jgi:hypothetical protein
MPTAYDFEQAAQLARRSRDDLGGARRALDAARAARAVSGGTVGPVVDTALTITAIDVEHLARRLDDLAVLCQVRARICADHAEALARYRWVRQQWAEAMERYRASLAGSVPLPHPGPEPRRPVPPAAWVEPR